MLVVAVVACGCGGSKGENPLATSVVVGRPAGAARSRPFSSAAGDAPAPRTCPAANPVLCPDGCCPTGATCKNGGGCTSSGAAPACPASAPVACSTAVTCAPSGCIGRDATAHHDDFALPPPTGFASGRFGTGVSTHQSGCTTAVKITAPASGLPSGNAAETIELWVNFPSGMPTGLAGIFAQDDRHIDLFTLNGSSQLEMPGPIQGGLAPDVWHFIAMTWDPATQQIDAYVDGAHWGPATVAGGFSTSAAAGVALGQDVAQACGMFPGTVDELRIESVALGAAQLATDYTSGELAADANTVGLWHFDEGTAARCCAAGDTCDASYGCVSPGLAASCAVACADGTGCCPSGEVCAPFSQCGVPGTSAVCPAGAPVSCANGSCCPSGDICLNGSCEHDATSNATSICPSGDVAVLTSTSTVACCPSLAGNTVQVQSGQCIYTPICSVGSICPSCPSTLTCPTGYTCNAGGQCTIAVVSTQSCASGVACAPTGCCAAGETCYKGACCPSGESGCGRGCCPTGMCTPQGNCVADPVQANCSITCPIGSTCQYGACVIGPEAPASCASGTPCGQHCCAADESCLGGQCAAITLASVCAAGETETACGCCPDGATCTGGACVEVEVPFMGPGGDTCGTGDFCPTGEFCTDGTLCCDADQGSACGNSCCGLDEDCVNGACACAADFPIACGASCCLAGEICSGGHCEAPCDDAGTPPCGDVCCNDGFACKDGECACTGDHPVACGTVCCLPDAPCLEAGQCGCPGARVACDGICCLDGESCSAAGECGPTATCDPSMLQLLDGTSTGSFTYDPCASNVGGQTQPDDATLMITVSGSTVLVTNNLGAAFMGSIDGDTITFGIATSEGSITYTGTIGSDCKLSGTWTETSPADTFNCEQGLAGMGHGTWSAAP